GISPGPLIFEKSGNIMYGIFAALVVANVFMLIFEYLGLKWFVKLLDVPKHILLPLILVLCIVGAYSTANRIFDVWSVFAFGLLGFIFKKLKIPSTPLIIGFILGSMAEVNLRRALMASNGNWSVFVSRPISLVFLLLAVGSVVLALKQNLSADKAAVVKNEDKIRNDD
ncbi:MAG: tripartite tricarboxylate transporter permease, partial [Spirochaetota bacterium]